MASNSLLFACFVLATLFLVSSQIAARELTESSSANVGAKDATQEVVHEDQYGGYGGYPRYGGYYGGYPRYGGYYGGYPRYGGYGGYPRYGGYGGYPRWGGGYPRYGGYPGYGGGYPAQAQNEPQN